MILKHNCFMYGCTVAQSQSSFFSSTGTFYLVMTVKCLWKLDLQVKVWSRLLVLIVQPAKLTIVLVSYFYMINCCCLSTVMTIKSTCCAAPLKASTPPCVSVLYIVRPLLELSTIGQLASLSKVTFHSVTQRKAAILHWQACEIIFITSSSMATSATVINIIILIVIFIVFRQK